MSTNDITGLPRFNELLRECMDSLEESDAFDPREPGDRAELRRLDEKYARDAEALIRFAHEHCQELIGTLKRLTEESEAT